MDVPREILHPARRMVAADDDVGAVEGSPAPDRHGDQGETVAVLDVGIAADPGGIELPREEQHRHLLVAAPLHEAHRPARMALEVALHERQQARIVVEEDGRQAEGQSRLAARRERHQRGARQHRREPAARQKAAYRPHASSRPVPHPFHRRGGGAFHSIHRARRQGNPRPPRADRRVPAVRGEERRGEAAPPGTQKVSVTLMVSV